jgi:hypothetical protein
MYTGNGETDRACIHKHSQQLIKYIRAGIQILLQNKKKLLFQFSKFSLSSATYQYITAPLTKAVRPPTIKCRVKI